MKTKRAVLIISILIISVGIIATIVYRSAWEESNYGLAPAAQDIQN